MHVPFAEPGRNGKRIMLGRGPFPKFEYKHAIVKNTKTSHGSKPFSTALVHRTPDTSPEQRDLWSALLHPGG